MLCKCNKKCFTYFDMTTGNRVYVCKLYDEKNKCDFRYCVEESSPCEERHIIEKKRYSINKLELGEEIEYLIKNFLANPLYSTFQQIELLSKKRYNPKKHIDIFEFLDELKDEYCKIH